MSYRYRFDVNDDGTWDNRKTFAFIDSGVPDGTYLSLLLWDTKNKTKTKYQQQVYTAIRMATYTLAAEMASMFGIPPERSLARFTSALRLRISNSPVMAAWLFVQRQSYTMLHLMPRAIILRARCR